MVTPMSNIERLKSQIQREVKLKVDELLKRLSPESLMYTRIGVTGSSLEDLQLYVKVILRKKLPVQILIQLITLLSNYTEQLQIDSPHRNAIRLSGLISRKYRTKAQ